MNVPLVMPFPTITCCQIGCVSNAGKLGSDPIAVG